MNTATPPDQQPFIVTAKLEESAFLWFNRLRSEHFPPERNLVPAHLTMFHALPSEQAALVADTLRDACTGVPKLRVHVQAPQSLGRGVAYRLVCPRLEALRSKLGEAWAPWLSRQDRASWRPHITIQNKVDPEVARALLAQLRHDFTPFDFQAEGLDLWRYLGGPWEPVGSVPFGAPGEAPQE